MKMTWILKVGNSAAVTRSANEAVVSASDGNPKHSLTRNGENAKAAARLNAMQKVAKAPRCFREPCRLCHSSFFFNYNRIGFLYLSTYILHKLSPTVRTVPYIIKCKVAAPIIRLSEAPFFTS